MSLTRPKLGTREFFEWLDLEDVSGGVLGVGCRAVASPCNCIGPQNGQPRCPCQMRSVVIKNGRYVVPEQDLGPV